VHWAAWRTCYSKKNIDKQTDRISLVAGAQETVPQEDLREDIDDWMDGVRGEIEVEIAKRRVNAVVSNQHQGSYDKVALPTAACVQVLQRRGQRARLLLQPLFFLPNR
jgi:hypothetical protein